MTVKNQVFIVCFLFSQIHMHLLTLSLKKIQITCVTSILYTQEEKVKFLLASAFFY